MRAESLIAAYEERERMEQQLMEHEPPAAAERASKVKRVAGEPAAALDGAGMVGEGGGVGEVEEEVYDDVEEDEDEEEEEEGEEAMAAAAEAQEGRRRAPASSHF